MAQILILARLCDLLSGLHIAEHFYEASALSDVLGVPASKVNEGRLYRTLDHLLRHKEELERHLKNRVGELLDLDYDLFLYDLTNTYALARHMPSIVLELIVNPDGRKVYQVTSEWELLMVS